MPKFRVHTYYEYVHTIEVEAETAQEACDKGYAIADKATTDDLQFCGYTSSEVIDENGELINV